MSTAEAPAVLDRLRRILREHFRLSEACGVASLFLPGDVAASDAKPAGAPQNPRRFLLRTESAPLRLRVAERLDLVADAVICDTLLGTVGLIHLFHPPQLTGAEAKKAGTSKEAARRDAARRRVVQLLNEAAYLRHLLLEDLRPGQPQQGRTPFIVEIVFVLLEEESEGDSNLRAWLGEELRSLTREATFLHAIGVNVLNGLPAETTPRFDAELRRAFPWLLRDSAGWYDAQRMGENAKPHPAKTASETSPAAGASEAAALLREVALENFRLPGTRTLKLDSEQALHVIHGLNGSGKSSFVEALELVATGRIERLRGQNHRVVITNRAVSGNGAASVSLSFASASPRLWRLTEPGVDQPPLAQLPAASFRINQGLADRLVSSSEQDRGAFFLGAFFPEGVELSRQVESARSEAEQALKNLPGRLRQKYLKEDGQFDPQATQTALAWLSEKESPWDRIRELLPVGPEVIEPLLPLLPGSFASHFHRTGHLAWDDAVQSAKTLDQGLAELLAKASALGQTVRDALQFLDAYGAVAAQSESENVGELPDLLNEWLSLVALNDLLEKEDAVLSTLETAGAAVPGTNPDALARFGKPLLAGVMNATNASGRQSALERLRGQRDEARRRVAGFRTAGERVRSGNQPLPPLARFRLEALDEAAAFGIFGPDLKDAQPALSRAVREAYQGGQTVAVQKASRVVLKVGDAGWGHELAERARRVGTALSRLPEAHGGPGGGQDRLETTLLALRSLQGAAARATDARAEAYGQFLQRLQGPLGDALNELVALLTPARWAYEDVVNRVVSGGASSNWSLTHDDQVPVELRLNTAQLNTFALSLFLLCMRARRHPLRLALLDDPFQNMDELTVIAISRGLVRLLRLCHALDGPGDRWRLLLFLHSHEDVERVRNEAPCAACFLPWLSPEARSTKFTQNIECEPSRLSDPLQDLCQLIRDPRPTPGAGHSIQT